MFYSYLRTVVSMLLWALNGNAHYHDKDNIPSPEENYILVAPHRSIWDPIYLAFATKPKQFLFMAKKELFSHRIFSWWIQMCGAFPIDRNHPGSQAIRYPVQMLKKSRRSLILFPSGSRHSDEVKGGAAVIAKLAKVRILPALYHGPTSLRDLIAGGRVDVVFGRPISVSDVLKLDEAGLSEVARRIETEFHQLRERGRAFPASSPARPVWWWIVRFPVLLFLLVLGLATVAFSWVASFVWDPVCHRR